jgi:hypothetical protein
MASRLIHYLIAEEITKINVRMNRDRFIYGSLLPDLSLHDDGSYDRAHFWERLVEKNRKGIDWNKFRIKYDDNMKTDSLYIGYYCHLIMDALWFSSITDKFVRIHPHPDRKIYYQKSYEDYKILNYLLSKQYNLKYHIPKIEDFIIDEINLSLCNTYLEGLKGDITHPDICDINSLKLYPYNVILEYIEHAKELCINEIEAFSIGKEFMNPVDLFTSEK